MANKLGYKSFADRALKTSAVRSADEVEYFLKKLSSNFHSLSEAEKKNISVANPDAWDMHQQGNGDKILIGEKLQQLLKNRFLLSQNFCG